ncbi:MAG: hypothetical protein ACLRP7_05750, partial [Christensenellales bacterium]
DKDVCKRERRFRMETPFLFVEILPYGRAVSAFSFLYRRRTAISPKLTSGGCLLHRRAMVYSLCRGRKNRAGA